MRARWRVRRKRARWERESLRFLIAPYQSFAYIRAEERSTKAFEEYLQALVCLTFDVPPKIIGL